MPTEEITARAPEPPDASSNSTKKKKWKYRRPPDLTQPEETVFLNMQLRKANRALSGTKARNTNYELVALAIILVIVYSVGYQNSDPSTQTNDAFVVLSFGHVVAIGVWLFVASFVTSTFAQSRFIELLTWMVIYLPLIAIVATFMLDGNVTLTDGPGNPFSVNYHAVVGIMLIVAEVLVAAIFLTIYFLVPKMLNSNWFRSKRQAAKWWRIKKLADWTMTYKRRRNFIQRHSCKYQGETNQDGLPHGIGRWFDDSPDGEVMRGAWKDGVPVAPFVSRHYGRGDVFHAVQIAYVMASDDEFDNNKFWPSNENPARCGIGSVECSVSGHFYNELPRASQLLEETPFEEETTISTLCQQLHRIGEDEDQNVLQIKADDPRGVQIEGYVHSITGKTFNKVDEINIKVQSSTEPASPLQRPSMQYMPKSKHHIFRMDAPFGKKASKRKLQPETIAEQDEDENNDETEEISPPTVQMTPIAETGDNKEVEVLEVGTNTTNKKAAEVKLSIDNWRPSKRKDALVFLPGFNCPLKQGLEGFGQFIAMTKLDAEIYPILFGWPSGQVLTYHSASRNSHNEQNKKNFCSLLKSLQNAGIRNVHLMSHSMGVQTLLGAFVDNEDGSRSDVSLCFKLAPRFVEGRISFGESMDEDDGNDNLLICRTATMLNPDYPLDAFVNHAFRSIRHICGTVTLVGDSQDGALFGSMIVNGLFVRFGYKQPRELLPNTNNTKHLRLQNVAGRSIGSLYLPEDKAQEKGSERIVFSERAPLTIVEEEDDLERSWLDLDVIDTSQLDTNIADIRHSAFNLNPILLNDLEELIRTNKRAMKRNSLLYRDGNMFSYCSAPSYVNYG